MTSAEVFDLQVLSTGHDSGLWVSATSRLGSVLALPVEDHKRGQLIAPERMSRLFRDTVKTGTRNAAKSRHDGDQLRDAVFGLEEVGSLLRRTRGAAAANGSSVLVRLFAAPASTAAVPWELMTDPDNQGLPLAMAADVHFARAAQVRTYPLRTAPIEPPINVLLVLSNPLLAKDDPAYPVFDHYEEGRALLGELQFLQDQGMLRVVVEDRPSVESLRRRISAEPRGFHIVHYLGHARPEFLKLEGRDGQPAWVQSREIGELLRRGCPDLRLVVFAGCQTAVAAEQDGGTVRRTSTSITDGVVQNACPNVIGMQAVLPFRTEQLFAGTFYQALCAGRSIAHAVNLARVAINADPIVGRELLDWAVPMLVTGGVAGPLIESGATGSPPTAAGLRHQLKLGLDEPDREFFARFNELRTVLDVLSRCRTERIAFVSGSPGVGKTRLLARALDELESEIGYVLYVGAPRLARPDAQGNVDPVGSLATLVAELLGRGATPPPSRIDGWTSAEWWERLVEEIVGHTFVLAIEDIDKIPDEVAEAIAEAIATLVRRRSRSRVVVTAQQPRIDLLGTAVEYSVPVRLEPVTLGDVSQWVERNRPGLANVLNGHSEIWPVLFRVLSSRLELWASLADAVDADDPHDGDEVIELAEKLASSRARRTSAARGSTESPVATSAPSSGRSRSGPLRVVVAGPHASGRVKQFAEVIAEITAQHGVAGRVLTGDGDDQATSIATLLETQSPFGSDGTASADDMLSWLQRVEALAPDVLLLDYGSPNRIVQQEQILRRMADSGTLLIAAGGHTGEPTYPAHLEFVFAVGALDGSQRPRPYSTWFSRQRKPDLYAQDDLSGGPIADTVPIQGETKGTSFAAIRVLVAAVVVWSVDRTRSAVDVRSLLIESSDPVRGRSHASRQRRLNVDAAVDAARANVVFSALKFGSLDVSGLAVATGLDATLAEKLARSLVEHGLAATGDDGRFELSQRSEAIGDTHQLAHAVTP